MLSLKHCALVLFVGCVLALLNFWLFNSQIQRNQVVQNDTNVTPIIAPKTEIPRYEMTTLGYSERGRPITAHQIGRGQECLLLFGGIHGNEKGTTELLETFIAELRELPEYVPDTKRLMIIPSLNPDGYFDREDNLNANGVNINRNFDTASWSQYQDNGVYAGQQPFSESEALAVKKAVEDCKPMIMVAFHSQGSLISPESTEASKQLAQWYADKTGYTYFDKWDYAGTATRWFSETTGNPAITVELPAHDQSDWQTQRTALLELIGRETLIN